MSLYTQLHLLLLNSGLTEIECNVYIEILKKPAHTVWELIGRTGISKSAAYRAMDRLKFLKLIKSENGLISALSLKALVADLENKDRKFRKTIFQLKNIAPFLRRAKEPIEEFSTLYTVDQIKDAYIFMSEIDYGVNLDFGDFENFIPLIGGIGISDGFRKNRLKHASHHAICTTFGSYTEHYSTKQATIEFKNKIDLLDLDFKNRWIIFSDSSDYVLFNNCEYRENPYSVLVKSRAIADAQRAQFYSLSRRFGK